MMRSGRFAVFLFAIAIPLLLCVNAQPSDDSKAKIKALKDYGKQGSDAIPKAAPYLDDADVEVRREAAKAIVAIGGRASLDPLVKATKDPDVEVQVRALEGLVNFYSPGYIQSGFSSSLKRTGGTLTGKFEELGFVAVPPGTIVRPEVIEALIAAAGAEHPLEVRADAARGLGVLRARPAVPVLVEALRSKDTRLIYESLIALQKIRDRSAGPRVVFLLRDPEERVQVAALETAGILTVKEALPGLKLVLSTTTNKKVRKAAQFSLAQIPDPSNHALYVSLLSDKEDAARAAGAEGLGRLGLAEDTPLLQSTYDNERKAEPRLAIAFALVALGNTDTSSLGPAGYLVNTLNTKAWAGVAEPYLSELALLSGPRAAILKALETASTPSEKIGIARALAGCGSADAIAPLEKLAKDDDATVGLEALRALKILRSEVK